MNAHKLTLVEVDTLFNRAFRAECSCGWFGATWQGEADAAHTAAVEDGIDHITALT